MNMSQTNHLIGVADADPVLVSTGFDEAIGYMTDEFVRKVEKDGVIEDITGNYITVKYDDGEIDVFPIDSIEKNAAKSIYISNEMELMPKIKAGKKVKAGDIMAYNKSYFKPEGKKLHLTPGPLVTVALHSTPATYEDSNQVSDKLCKRMSTKVVKPYSVILGADAKIHDAITSFTEVHSGDPLMIYETMTGDEDIDAYLGIESSELNKREKKAKRGGKVVDIKVYRTCNLDDLSNSIQHYIRKIDDFMLKDKTVRADIMEKKGKGINKILHSKKNTKVKVGDKVNGVKMERDEVMFEFYVETVDMYSKGDKSTGHTAIKFINGHVEKEENMPVGVDSGRRVDVMISPYSVSKRMVNSIIISGYLGAAVQKLTKQCKEDLGIG